MEECQDGLILVSDTHWHVKVNQSWTSGTFAWINFSSLSFPGSSTKTQHFTKTNTTYILHPTLRISHCSANQFNHSLLHSALSLLNNTEAWEPKFWFNCQRNKSPYRACDTQYFLFDGKHWYSCNTIWGGSDVILASRDNILLEDYESAVWVKHRGCITGIFAHNPKSNKQKVKKRVQEGAF